MCKASASVRPAATATALICGALMLAFPIGEAFSYALEQYGSKGGSPVLDDVLPRPSGRGAALTELSREDLDPYGIEDMFAFD